MTKNEIILKIEEEVKQIFAKDHIRRLDVIKANRLIDEWKLLTDYKINKISVLDKTSQQVLDNIPMWSKNLIINYETNRKR
jgi:hypothetical protein